MMQLPWLWIALGVAALLVFILSWWWGRQSQIPPCPHCDEKQKTKIRRVPVQSRTIEIFRGGGQEGPSSDFRLQTDFDVIYRCDSCRKEVVMRITETQ